MATNGELMSMSNGTYKFTKLINNNNLTNINLYESVYDDQIVNNALLDKIRKRSKFGKTWNDLAKISRTLLNEKRTLILSDHQEKGQLQRCLDTIQKSIKVTSLQSMVDRLESITRQSGLKFTALTSTNPKESNFLNVFLSSDSFYVEIIFEPSGYVNDVKVAHQSDPVSCPILTKVVRDADFVELNKHLNGFLEIYKLNVDKNKKIKAYIVLNALEQDLNILSKLQSSSIIEPNNLVHKSPVGILEPRVVGRPMKLTYFISPYDLLDEERKVSLPLSIDIITEKKLGYSSTVCIENSSIHKLQTTSLVSITKSQDGKSLPIISALNSQNSTSLPACFALKLPESLPISIEIMNKIKQAANGLDVIYETANTPQSLISLLTKKMLPKKEFSKFKSVDDPFYVELPDQCHTYYFNSSISNIMGVEAISIPFLHPTSVPKILGLLRQQVLFNVLISSCIRKLYRKELSKTDNPLMMFEITALSITSISVSFEHPVEESLATIDFDLDEITNIKAKLYDSQSFSTYCSDEHVSLVMQRCFSIPVTMRSVIKKCQDKVTAVKEELRKKQAQMMQIRQNDIYNNENNFYNNQQMISNDSSERTSTSLINNKFENYQQQSNNMIATTNNLQSMLQSNQRANYQQQSRNFAQQQQQQQTKPNTMLMTMLSDVPAANSQASINNSNNTYFIQQPKNSNLTNNFNQQPSSAAPTIQPKKKQRKRKGQQDTSNIKSPSNSGRSPKRKISEDELSYDLPTPGSDYSYDNFHSVGSNQQLSRPSSNASSNSVQFLRQDQDADSNSQHLLNETNNFNSFLDNSNSSSFEFTKRKRSLDNSCYQDKLNDEHELMKYDDLNPQDNFNQTKLANLNKNYSIPKSSNGSLIDKKIGTLETMLKDAASSNVPTQKKERKRKKTETDANKNVNLSMMLSNSVQQLMPPPNSTLATNITTSSPTSSNINSNTYGFVELDSNSIGSPALRPITLNVKPSIMTSTNLNLSNIGIKMNDKNQMNKLKQSSKTELSDFSTPTYYSPKNSPKTSKTNKQPKTNTSTSNNNSSTATSPKSQSPKQSLKLKSLNTTGLTITKTTLSSTPSPVSVSPPTSASPLSPKTQNPLSISSNNKTVQAKKNKGSLNAVIDKLNVRVNASTSNIDDNSLGSLSSNSASSKDSLQSSLTSDIMLNKNEINKAESSSSMSNVTNKMINTSPASLSKLNESKAKYTKLDYTVKQSSVSGLKFTVTKTTKSPSMEAKTAKASSSKPPITNKNLSSLSSSSSLNTSNASSLFQQQKQSSANKTSAGIKRQLNASSSNFKPGQQSSNKSGTTKSLSPESADQILEAALPKIHLDKLPKIPKTLNSQFSQQQQQQAQQQVTQLSSAQTVQQPSKNNLQAKFLQQQHLKQQQAQNLLRQQLNYNNSLNNSSNQLHFRKYNTPNQNQRTTTGDQSNNQTGQDLQFGNASVTMPKSSNDNQQASTTTTTTTSCNHPTSFNQDNESQNKNESVKSANKFSSQSKSNISSNTTGQSASASSIAVTASSTPSSPMECNVISDVYQKSPPLIPTETIEETNPNLTSTQKTKNLFEIPNAQKKNLENTIAKLSADRQHSISISSFNLPSTSKLITTPEVKKLRVFDDEDDDERLLIDEDHTNKKSNSSTPSKSNETKVQSSPIRNLEKSSSIDSISSGQTNISSAITTNSTSSISANESPVSNNSITNPKQSPFSIDDDLMDEALIGSGV